MAKGKKQFEGMNYCTKCEIWFQPETRCNCYAWAFQRPVSPYWIPPYYPYPYYPPYWTYSVPLTGGMVVINNDGISGGTSTVGCATIGGSTCTGSSVDIRNVQAAGWSYTTPLLQSGGNLPNN